MESSCLGKNSIENKGSASKVMLDGTHRRFYLLSIYYWVLRPQESQENVESDTLVEALGIYSRRR